MHRQDTLSSQARKKVLVLGATGTIGRATTTSLTRRGHDVTCFVRRHAGTGCTRGQDQADRLPEGAAIRFGEVTDAVSLRRDGFGDARFDVVISCLASRDGTPQSAWAIDYQANREAMNLAVDRDVQHFILLSAICVQKPRLEFQHAKLASEKALTDSGMRYSIVRPTAYFKSLSGQIDRLKNGRPFLCFGDGALTACKPISDRDLGEYLADCIDDPTRHDRILPIGGPGPAITPKQQGEHLFSLLGRAPRFKHVPVGMLDTVGWSMGKMSRLMPSLSKKAELARIGRYYATESMLVLDPETGRYDETATPSTGSETLFDYYAKVLKGQAEVERGEHSVF